MTQGGVAAVVGAALGATTEPVVNKVLVQRMSLTDALATFSFEKALNFFLTATLPTNLLKYPFYEVVNMLLSTVDLPDTGKGVIIGAVFTTVTLPLGSYRCVTTCERSAYLLLVSAAPTRARERLQNERATCYAGVCRPRSVCRHTPFAHPHDLSFCVSLALSLSLSLSHCGQVLRVAEHPRRWRRVALHCVLPHAVPRHSIRRSGACFPFFSCDRITKYFTILMQFIHDYYYYFQPGLHAFLFLALLNTSRI